jgi:ethanolamine ammonia-lyase large subunit
MSKLLNTLEEDYISKIIDDEQEEEKYKKIEEKEIENENINDNN